MATGSVRSLVRSIGTASKAVDITSVDEQPLCKGIYIGNILGTWYFSVGAGVARQTATLALSTAIVTVTSTSGYFVGSTLTKQVVQENLEQMQELLLLIVIHSLLLL